MREWGGSEDDMKSSRWVLSHVRIGREDERPGDVAEVEDVLDDVGWFG